MRTRLAAAVCLATAGLPALAALATWFLVALPSEVAVGWPESMPLLPHAAEVLVLMVLLFPVWLGQPGGPAGRREVSTRTKWFLAAIGPTTFILVLTTMPLMGVAMTNVSVGIGGLVCIGALGSVLAWIVATGRRVWRETAPVR